MSHNFVGLSFLYMYSLSISLLKFAHHDVSICYCQLLNCQLVLQKVRRESYRASDYLSVKNHAREKKTRNKLDSFAFIYVLSSSSNNYWIQISRKREQQFLFVLKYFTFYCQVNYRISHFDVYMYMIIIPFILYPNYCDKEDCWGYFLSQ